MEKLVTAHGNAFLYVDVCDNFNCGKVLIEERKVQVKGQEFCSYVCANSHNRRRRRTKQ
jgi:hypothetical protein